MITSHLDLRLRQNYDYISRSRWERPAVLALRACLRRRRKEVIRLLHRRLAPPGLSGRGVAPASLAVAAAVRAGPDEAEAFAFLVVEEVGVDRGVEAGIIELQAQIGAPLVGGLGPGGADLGAADEDAVAGGVQIGRASCGERVCQYV